MKLIIRLKQKIEEAGYDPVGFTGGNRKIPECLGYRVEDWQLVQSVSTIILGASSVEEYEEFCAAFQDSKTHTTTYGYNGERDGFVIVYFPKLVIGENQNEND